MTLLTGPPCSGAERTRRSRERQKRGGVLIQFEVVGTALDNLTELGWLAVSHRTDKEAVTTALIGLAATAFAKRLNRQ